MSASFTVNRSLRILGLPPGATASEVRAAFRHLAKTCHPDIVGRQGMYKFQQITGAYTFLKGLTQEELRSGREEQEEAAPAPARRAWGWNTFFARNPAQSEEAEEQETQQVCASREAEEAARRAKEASISNILSKGERAVDGLLRRAEQESQRNTEQDLHLRLLSDNPQIRWLALSQLGLLINQQDFLNETAELLRKWEIDEKTANLVSLLPLTPENHRWLAARLAEKASAVPNALLTFLLRLQNGRSGLQNQADRDLLERYLEKATPGGVALILRSWPWPRNSFLSAALLCRLLSCEDEAVLVPLLSAMKQRAIPCPPGARELLTGRLQHPNAAVRIWAKALLSAS